MDLSQMTSPAPIMFTDGSAYERFMAPWSKSAGKIFMDWLAEKPGQSWVDVGCGNGAFTELIVGSADPKSVSAIDPSEAQIATARQKLSGKPVEFHIGDAMALPFTDDQFDVSVMALVLFFVSDPHKGVAEMARVAKPGGLVASYTWDGSRGGSPNRHVVEELEAIEKPAPRAPSYFVSRFETLKALWNELGMTAIETRELVVERTFVNFDDYWLSTVVSSPFSIVDKLTDRECAELRRRLQGRLPTALDGHITVHSWATAIKGFKAT